MSGTPDNAIPLAPAPAKMVYEMHLHQAAQMGNLKRIQVLISTGANTAIDRDATDVTPLHWAALNNRVEVALYLINHGAGGEHIDARGGELQATPLHWACRHGHLQMVTILLKYGANPNLTDLQGFNPLHLTCQFGHPMLTLYLLNVTELEVDSLDPSYITPLMWSAYKGNSLENLSLLMKYGADIDKKDANQCTALHWAVMKDNREAATVLLHAGARIDIPNDQGKTALDYIKERPWDVWWSYTQKEWGMHAVKSNAKNGWENFDKKKKIIYGIPYVIMLISLLLLVHTPWFVSIFLIGIMVWGVTELIPMYLIPLNHLVRTPFLSSFFQASVFYVQLTYLFVVLPNTLYLHPFVNLLHIIFSSAFPYSYARLFLGNPGFIQSSGMRTVEKRVVVELAEAGQLDRSHFCITCLIRRPLRSKHCQHCDACVAKFDHHCPYTNSCIGAGNHRDFIFFLIFVILAKSTFVYLGSVYMNNMYIEYDPDIQLSKFCYFGSTICTYFAVDSWTLIVIGWTALNEAWVILLFCFQIYQICVGKTTNENINSEKYSYLKSDEDRGNAFDHGVLNNLYDFFSNGGGANRHINWATIYETPKRDTDCESV